MKNKELLFGALGEIEPAFLREAEREEKAGVPERKRRFRPAAAALLAAAVLALTAAVGAGAEYITSRLSVRVGDRAWDGYRHLYDVGQEGLEPYVTLSGEVMDRLRALEQETDRNAHHSAAEMIERGMAYGFDTWREAADFLDCGILTSPLLRQPPERFGNNRIALCYLDGVSLGRPEEIVDLFGQNVVPFTAVDAEIPEKETEEDWGFLCDLTIRIPLNAEACGMGFGGTSVPAETSAEVAVSDYRTPQGDEVKIVSVLTDEWRTISCRAYFLHDSLSYILSASARDRDTAEAVLRAVLDSLE